MVTSRYSMYGTTVYYKCSEDIALTVTSRYLMYGTTVYYKCS